MKKLILALVLSVALLTGCGAHMFNPGEEAGGSLVYGFIDMNDAPTGVDYVTMRQYLPKTEKPYWHAKGVDGIFWFDQFVNGSYQLVSFGGSGFFRGQYEYNMQEFSKNDTSLVISKSGLYYVGSYKYKKAGSFFNPKFEIIKVDSPAERELLGKMLPYSKDTQWEAMIKKRMGELE